MKFLEPLSSQWQLAFLVLCVVMGALLWRGHRQASRLASLASAMADQLKILARSVEAIEGRTTNTEHTLVANLSEYRMALGNTSSYRQYLQKLGVAPAADVEPVLEAIPDAAVAVGQDGRIVYVNRTMYELTGLQAGSIVSEVVQRFKVRAFDGRPFAPTEMPEVRVLSGERVREVLVRVRPEGVSRDVIFTVNGSPVRDINGRVVAAVMISRMVSEEVALAIEVRQLAERDRVTVAAGAGGGGGGDPI